MRITKQVLSEHKIYNPHDIAKRGGAKLYIDYTPQETGRMYQNASWQVIGVGFKTDPDGHWHDYGHKTFAVYRREEKKPQLEKAMAWCQATYGITEWERSPFGGYQIKGTISKALINEGREL